SDNGEREVDREMRDLPALNDIERSVRRRQRDAVVEYQEIDVPRRKQRRRDVHRGDQPLVPDNRPGKDEKEVQRQRRQQDRRQLFDELQHLVREIDVARRRVDVDDEREKRDKEEQRALLPSPAEQREETDGQIKKSDEAEDQVGVVDLQFRYPIGQPQHLVRSRDDHRNRLTDPPERFLKAFHLVAWRVADQEDLVAGSKTGLRRATPRIDRLHND